MASPEHPRLRRQLKSAPSPTAVRRPSTNTRIHSAPHICGHLRHLWTSQPHRIRNPRRGWLIHRYRRGTQMASLQHQRLRHRLDSTPSPNAVRRPSSNTRIHSAPHICGHLRHLWTSQPHRIRNPRRGWLIRRFRRGAQMGIRCSTKGFAIGWTPPLRQPLSARQVPTPESPRLRTSADICVICGRLKPTEPGIHEGGGLSADFAEARRWGYAAAPKASPSIGLHPFAKRCPPAKPQHSNLLGAAHMRTSASSADVPAAAPADWKTTSIS
jgi:hypothetical protein